ncbi:MAG: hypothetical protein WBD27_13360 [Pyrinomonadaceae bacterium]
MSISVELDERIASKIDIIAESSKKNRSECTNDLLRKALRRETIEEKLRRHKEGYSLFPVRPAEFEIEDEQMENFWEQA